MEEGRQGGEDNNHDAVASEIVAPHDRTTIKRRSNAAKENANNKNSTTKVDESDNRDNSEKDNDSDNEEEDSSPSPTEEKKIESITKSTTTNASSPSTEHHDESEQLNTNNGTTPEMETATLRVPDANADDTNNNNRRPQRRQQQQQHSNSSNNNNNNNMISSIVIRQTEETLQHLQRNLHIASIELLHTLGQYLISQKLALESGACEGKGITLPASAIGWLSNQYVQQQQQRHHHQQESSSSMLLLTTIQQSQLYLTRLRVTADPWPSTTTSTSTASTISNTTTSSNTNNHHNTTTNLHQYYNSLQTFHQLRYSPIINMNMLTNLQVLLLDQVPSTWIYNLQNVATTLQVLRIERSCIYDLEILFFSNSKTITINGSDSGNSDNNSNHNSTIVKYSQLTHLKLSYCNLGEMTKGLIPRIMKKKQKKSNDDNIDNKINHNELPTNNSDLKKLSSTIILWNRLPIANMPKLRSLSLAHNDIRSEKTVMRCGISNATKLNILDLSYNYIPSLMYAPTYVSSKNLTTLLLTGNQITSSKGIDQLCSLQTLALDYNQISLWTDIAGLARLQHLKLLKLYGNPFMKKSSRNSKKHINHARVMLLDLFREQRWSSLLCNFNDDSTRITFGQLKSILPIIDDKVISSRELKALQQRAFFTIIHNPTTSRIATGSTDDDNREFQSISVTTNSNNVGRQVDSSTNRIRIGGRLRKRRNKQKKVAIIEEGLPSQTDAVHMFRQATSSRRKIPALAKGASTKASGKSALLTATNEKAKRICDTAAVALGTSSKSFTETSPKLSFSINDVLSSLHQNKSRRQRSDDEISEQKQHDMSADNELNNTEPDKSKELGHFGMEDTEYEWPQPIAYVPEHNLYDEFVWEPPTAVTLGGGGKKGKTKSKRKGRKEKNSRSKKLRQKAAPSISTISPANDPSDGLDTFSRKANLRQNTRDSTSCNVGAKEPPSKVETSPVSAPVSNSSAPVSNSDLGSVSRLSSIAQDEQDIHEAKIENGTWDDTAGNNVDPAKAATGDDNASTRSYHLRSVSYEGDENDLISPNSISGAAFGMAMDAGGNDDNNTCSSLGTSISGAASRSEAKRSSEENIYHLAEAKSKFLGLEQQRNLGVMENLDLYFRTFVFPDFFPNIDAGQLSCEDDNNWQSVFFRFPRIQMLSRDRELREKSQKNGGSVQLQRKIGETDREQFIRVWREDVVACGKPALRRLPPNRTAHFGYHGDLSWLDGKVKTVSECRQVILCLSNTSFYVILDNDSLTAKEHQSTSSVSGTFQSGSQSNIEASSRSPRKSRKFPSPIPKDAAFEQALWPHAVACHPLEDIIGITIGFGFQRLTIRVRNSAYPSAVGFTYLLLTSNKIRTVELLQELQSLVKELKVEMGTATLAEESIKIDNDDKQFLDGVAAAVAPEPVGAVLHYQLLRQRWKHGQRGAVSRICVVTDSKIFLLDEDYVGDGTVSMDAQSGRRLGYPIFRLIDAADLVQIAEVRAADADPNAITIVIRPTHTLSRTHRWRLICRDRIGAEKLVEDVRKGMLLVD